MDQWGGWEIKSNSMGEESKILVGGFCLSKKEILTYVSRIGPETIYYGLFSGGADGGSVVWFLGVPRFS